jgi:hypothetical protein
MAVIGVEGCQLAARVQVVMFVYQMPYLRVRVPVRLPSEYGCPWCTWACWSVVRRHAGSHYTRCICYEWMRAAVACVSTGDVFVGSEEFTIVSALTRLACHP